MNKSLTNYTIKSRGLGFISISVVVLFVGIAYLTDSPQACAFFGIVESIPSPVLCTNGNVIIPPSWPEPTPNPTPGPTPGDDNNTPVTPIVTSGDDNNTPTTGCGYDSCDDDDNNTPTIPACPAGTVQTSDGGCTTPCPANNTLIGSSCCPNQYVVTTTVGSGKGQNTVRSCNIPPPTPPTATISQSKATTITGEAFTVSYGKSGEGAATSCVLQRQSPGGSYAQIASNSGNTSSKNENISTVGSYGYQAQCYGPGGSSAWTSLTHTVIVPPPTLSFSADQYLIPYNTATTLRWTSANTVSCAASSDWSGAKSTNGSESTGNLTELSTYFLQCQGRANQSTNPAVVNVNIEYGEGSIIEVTPTITHKNTPVTVTWNTGTSNPANCQIETGSVVLRSPLTSNTGSLTYTVNGETTFTINCEAGHNIDQATVKVLPDFQET